MVPVKLKRDTCKGCGREIVWARVMVRNAETGKLEPGAACPMDPRPPVYRVTQDERGAVVAFRANGAESERTLPQDNATYLVSHFATCQRAGDFSSSRRRDA